MLYLKKPNLFKARWIAFYFNHQGTFTYGKSLLLLLVILFISILPRQAAAQTRFDKKLDSLNRLLANSKPDTNRSRQLAELAYLYANYSYTLKSKPIADKAIALATKQHYSRALGIAYNALGTYYYVKADTVNALKNYQLAYSLSKRAGDKKNLADIRNRAYVFLMIAHIPTLGNPAKNLEVLKEANIKLTRALFFEYPKYILYAYRKIIDVYDLVNDEDKIQKQSLLALEVAQKYDLPENASGILERLSVSYLLQKNYVKAEKVLLEALAVENAHHIMPTAYNNLIACYRLQKKYSQSLYYGKLALNVPKLSPAYKGTLMMNIGVVYIEAPDSLLTAAGIDLAKRYTDAIKNIEYGLSIAKITDDKYIEQQCYLFLSQAYEKLKDHEKAYDYQVKYNTIKDELNDKEKKTEFLRKDAEAFFNKKKDSLNYLQQLSGAKLKQQQQVLLLNQQKLQLSDKDNKVTQANLVAEQNRRKANEQQLKASQKEQALANTTVQLQKNEISAKRKQSYYLFGGIAALLGLSFFIARNYSNQRKANKQIMAEKQRSDELLLNILPADVAEELKTTGGSEARLFDEVTVLFTDFVNFTQLSELLTPKELVNELNICFKAFDGIMNLHQIEKIKTIGDAYLAVAGLPNADANHAANTIKAAQAIQQFIHERKLALGDKTFDIRIGIHSGSVVAGIVGVKKFAYDIWGDTVNTAARMEQHSEPGKINISEKTYELVKDQFAFTYRGEIAAKNKGALKMYFLG